MRCEVLLGNFIRLNKLHIGAKAAMTATDQNHMIALAPPTPRFSLLPISSGKTTLPELHAWRDPVPPHLVAASVFDRLAARAVSI